MDEKMRKLIHSITYTANVAKDEALSAVQSASKALNEKAETAKLRLELLGLQADMEELFCGIGRTMYQMNTGTYNSTLHGEHTGEDSAQKEINALLVSAGELQQKIDDITDRLRVSDHSRICPVCGKVCEEEALYCPACGAHLLDPPAPAQPKAAKEEDETTQE